MINSLDEDPQFGTRFIISAGLGITTLIFSFYMEISWEQGLLIAVGLILMFSFLLKMHDHIILLFHGCCILAFFYLLQTYFILEAKFMIGYISSDIVNILAIFPLSDYLIYMFSIIGLFLILPFIYRMKKKYRVSTIIIYSLISASICSFIFFTSISPSYDVYQLTPLSLDNYIALFLLYYFYIFIVVFIGFFILETSREISTIIEIQQVVSEVMEDSLETSENNQILVNKQNKMINKNNPPNEVLNEMVEKYKKYRSWKRVSEDYDDYTDWIIRARVKEFLGEENYRKLLGKEPPKKYRSSKKRIDDQVIEAIIINIKKTAKDKGIKLKMFFQQLQEFKDPPSDIKRVIFESSAILLQKIITQGNLPVLEARTYQTSLGKSYIKRGEEGFDYFNLYSHVIYEIHSLFNMGTDTDIYIGHTEKAIKRRFEYHIDDSIKGYAKEWDFPSRMIEKAILLAIRKEVIDLEQFITEYQALSIDKRLSVRDKLADILLNKYFKINILEKHYTKNKVSEREKWYKENYPNYNGTVFPYGLNMHSYAESVGEYVALPLYDIAFMISIGYRVPEISKIIIKLYGIKEASEDNVYSRISQFFNGIENAEDKFLRIVVQSIIERFPNLTGDQIGKLIHRRSGRQFFDSQGCPFKRWFGDFKLNEVKKAVSIDGFNWNNVDYFIEEIRKGNYIKGHFKSQWIELFIKGVSNEELAKFAGYKHADSFRKHFFKLKESTKAFNVSNRKEAVKKYRKLKTIETLRNSKAPSFSTLEYLYTDIFGFQSRKEYVEKYKDSSGGDFLFKRALKNYFEKLFDGMSLNEIIER